jgi:hypothetical protein
MEHEFTIPQIKAFLSENKLTFLGFRLSEDVIAQFRKRHPDSAPIKDLDSWHEFELSYPRFVESMYVFWVQKAQS